MSDEVIDISNTLIAKADQLNAVDLTQPLTGKIVNVALNESVEQPLSVWLDSFKQPWKPCKIVRRMLGRLWGTNAAEWKGRMVQLFNDPEVRYGPNKTGGIRISHVSHIDKPRAITLQVGRNKYQEFTINPMAQKTEPSEAVKPIHERCRDAVKCYDECSTNERLTSLDKHIDALIEECSDAQRQLIAKAREAAIARVAS